MAKQSSVQKTVLCWCGSGQQYSKCHRDRDEQIPLKSYEIDAEFRKAFAKKYCLHPQSSSAICSQHIVKAHSVSVSSNLDCIAENGHVMHFGFPPKASVEAFGRLTAQSIGVNKASTFTGFCHLHDSQTFTSIDQRVTVLAKEHYFLLAYRALCRELFTKAAAFSLNETARQLDKGKDRSAQLAIQNFCAERELGLTAGLRDLHHQKTEFDRHLLRRSFESISSYVIELDHAPQIVCSVGFTPEVDFKGNKLQSLEFPANHTDMCTCSIILTRRGGAIVFAWLTETNGACSRLIESLDNLKTPLIPSAVVRLLFEYGENVFFSKSWWSSLDQKTQAMLEDRANSLYDKAANTLLDDGLRPVFWSIVSKRRYPALA